MEDQNTIAATTNILLPPSHVGDSKDVSSKSEKPVDFLKMEKSEEENTNTNNILSSPAVENPSETSHIADAESQRINEENSLETEPIRTSNCSATVVEDQNETSKNADSACHKNSDVDLSERVEERESCAAVKNVNVETKMDVENLHEESIDLKEEVASWVSPESKGSILASGCEESTRDVAQNGKDSESHESIRTAESNDSNDRTDNQENRNSIVEENVSTIPENSLHELKQENLTSNVSRAVDVIERTTEMVELVEYSNLEKMKEESVAVRSEFVETVVLVEETETENGVGVPDVKAETSNVMINESVNSTEPERIEERLGKGVDSGDEKMSIDSDTDEELNNEKCISPKMKLISNIPDTSLEKTNDSTNSSISTSSQNPAKQRSVIEDIFEDWQDENPEEESSQQPPKSHDSVEMELKILLREDKPESTCDEKSEDTCDDGSGTKLQDEAAGAEKPENATAAKIVTKESAKIAEALRLENAKQQKKKEDYPAEETGRARRPDRTDIPVNREKLTKQKPPGPRPGVKVPGVLLTSPIVTKSDVSKVLKERIREQQKDFDSPTKPDLFFVKKITQRLSHKLAAASAAAQVPGLLPIPQISNKPPSEVKKSGTSGVDKELLAILEGDVDPDWSNLRGHDEPKSKSSVESGPAKLDPTMERELALKQLLELPSALGKKVTKKTASKSPRAKTTKAKTAKRDEEASVNSIVELTDVKEDSLDSSASSQSTKNDETRSGRKRKPTEKAREHENITKRLKIVKGRSGVCSSQESNNVLASDSADDKNDSETPNDVEISPVDDGDNGETVKKRIHGELTSKDADSSEEVKNQSEKKVSSKPSAKRKIQAGQKLSKKPGLGARSKVPKGIGKKTGTKVTSGKGSKQRLSSSSAASNETKVETKPKKKMINEIDRLLQDEGVVNLLYDVEQPDKKRFVPITKSQTKVMDIQKIQRELKIRTKLVRNAVLRLRTSNVTSNKVSPRSKRSVSHSNEFSPDKKSNESKVVRTASPTPDFIYPAKIRNAADASIIIRRHSSSSFSSASVSPRASIDGPERLSFDGGKFEDSFAGTHALRSNKRRVSIEEDKKKKKAKVSPEPKRMNRRRTTERSDSESKAVEDEYPTILSKNKSSGEAATRNDIPSTPRSRKLDKRNTKLGKHVEVFDVDAENSGTSKIATRSNGATSGFGDGKVIPKSKKSVKCKVTFAHGTESMSKKIDSSPGQQDELSACLAEAVTALSNDSGGSSRCRSNIPVNRNKTKGNSSSAVKNFVDEIPLKKEPKVQFSNNEIMVQRHGKLVQLLLTPSTTTKIRNGITLQVMQEIRENLSILKKDEDCRVVLLTSTGTSFCKGLDLSTLLHENKEERRLRAEELANAVKEFIKSLATFNKPIVAGVQGTAIGLGVTMLPWFDLVIASDKATFSTPYGKLGQIAEGAAIFTLSHILGSAVTSDLLLGGRTLTANEALRAGLVTRVLWPDRFKDELLPSLRAMSEQSSQSMEATKALLRHSLRKKLDAALESESYLLVQHWCSAECQAAITAYVDEKIH